MNGESCTYLLMKSSYSVSRFSYLFMPFSNVKVEEKSRTLRMYCDICEEFDVHETEDCPKQASDPDQNSKHGVARGSERPYCDACEGKLFTVS